MPDYPVNKADVDGNTRKYIAQDYKKRLFRFSCHLLNSCVAALLLAYTQGNGALCRSLVKSKVCLGAMNKQGITIFNFQVPTKQLLYRQVTVSHLY